MYSKRGYFFELELVSSSSILLYVFMEIFIIYNMQGRSFKTHITDLEWVTFLELKLRVDALKYYFTCTHIKYNIK